MSDRKDNGMALTNKGIAERFVTGGERGKACNMEISVHLLYSYNTVIAERVDENTIAVNPKKYSQSTSRQVSTLVWELRQAGYEPTGEVVPPIRSGRIFYGEDYTSDEPFEIYRKVNTGAQAA